MFRIQDLLVLVVVCMALATSQSASAQCIEGLSLHDLVQDDDTTFCSVTPSALCAQGVPAISNAARLALILGLFVLGAFIVGRRHKSLGSVVPTIALSAMIAGFAYFRSPSAVWAHDFRKTPMTGLITHFHRPAATERELTAAEKTCINNDLATAHPGATRVGDPTISFDCHGLTFDPAQTWINNDQVVQALADNGRMVVAGAKMVGDIIVYRNVAGNVTHSGKVTAVDVAGAVTQVRSKWGLSGTYDHPPTGAANSPYSADTVSYYR